MKHFKHLLLVLFALVTFSCGKSEPEKTEPTPTPKPTDKIELAAGTDLNPVISTDGGTLSVTFNASTAWSAQAVNDRADSWCSVSPTSGNTGAATITITAKANTEPDERSASINIRAGSALQTIRVTQKQKDALTVTASTFEVPAEGKDINIEVKANVNVTYKIDQQCSDWIKYVSTKALKTSTLTFAVSKNENVEKREGKIIIGEGALSDTIKIFQAGEATSIVLNKDEYIAKSEGETFAIEVASNVDVNINILHHDGSPTWLQEHKTKTMSTNTYYFTAATNEEYDNREARIVFANKENNLSDTIRVTQLQKDAIIIAKNLYEFGIDGGNLDFEIQTNVDVKVEISDNANSWITQIETRGLQTKSLCFNVAKCNETDERQGTIKLSGGKVEQIITVKQNGLKEILEKERAALIAFYNATGGDNWTNNENWCSDEPVSEWYGVRTENKVVTSLELIDNNLIGTIPVNLSGLANLNILDLSINKLHGQFDTEAFNLEKLHDLYLHNNKLSGDLSFKNINLPSIKTISISNNELYGVIHSSISKLTTLEYLLAAGNHLKGEIPLSISHLKNLRQFAMHENKLTGSIPESFANLDFSNISLYNNKLSGSIPQIIKNTTWWKEWYWQILYENDFDTTIFPFPAPLFSNEVTINGKSLPYDIYQNNKLTILYYFGTECPFSEVYTPILKDIYESYRDKGLNVISLSIDDYEDAISYINRHQLSWDVLVKKPHNARSIFFPTGKYIQPLVSIIDECGNMIYCSVLRTCNIYSDVSKIVKENLGEIEVYESGDFSYDGKVSMMQTATKGHGIDVIFMGDGYSDRMITDGTYDTIMSTAFDKLFTEEPYKSFKDLFNVYSIKVVSKNEGYGENKITSLGGYFGEGTLVGGNDKKVLSYVEEFLEKERIEAATIIVMMNSNRYAGTCYMYHPHNNNGNWGNGASISYFPVGNNDESLAQVLHHEACGHGFAKLADEYSYEYMETIPSEEVTKTQTQQKEWGWWKNVDFTDDLSLIKWTKFISDARYQYEGLGAFEGGLTYWSGVWRPTDNSIMRYNYGGFNAPSREAIYYRIHKLAYGPDWEYDYEKFVEYDAINRKTSSRSQSPQILPLQPKEPLHPPVIVNKTLEEVLNRN